MLGILLLVAFLIIWLGRDQWLHQRPVWCFDNRLRGEIGFEHIWISWNRYMRQCATCLEDFTDIENPFCGECSRQGP